MFKITFDDSTLRYPQTIYLYDLRQRFTLKDAEGNDREIGLAQVVCSGQLEDDCGGKCPLADICGWTEAVLYRSMALIMMGKVAGVTAEEIWCGTFEEKAEKAYRMRHADDWWMPGILTGKTEEAEAEKQTEEKQTA